MFIKNVMFVRMMIVIIFLISACAKSGGDGNKSATQTDDTIQPKQPSEHPIDTKGSWIFDSINENTRLIFKLSNNRSGEILIQNKVQDIQEGKIKSETFDTIGRLNLSFMLTHTPTEAQFTNLSVVNAMALYRDEIFGKGCSPLNYEQYINTNLDMSPDSLQMISDSIRGVNADGKKWCQIEMEKFMGGFSNYLNDRIYSSEVQSEENNIKFVEVNKKYKSKIRELISAKSKEVSDILESNRNDMNSTSKIETKLDVSAISEIMSQILGSDKLDDSKEDIKQLHKITTENFYQRYYKNIVNINTQEKQYKMISKKLDLLNSEILKEFQAARQKQKEINVNFFKNKTLRNVFNIYYYVSFYSHFLENLKINFLKKTNTITLTGITYDAFSNLIFPSLEKNGYPQKPIITEGNRTYFETLRAFLTALNRLNIASQKTNPFPLKFDFPLKDVIPEKNDVSIELSNGTEGIIKNDENMDKNNRGESVNCSSFSHLTKFSAGSYTIQNIKPMDCPLMIQSPLQNKEEQLSDKRIVDIKKRALSKFIISLINSFTLKFQRITDKNPSDKLQLLSAQWSYSGIEVPTDEDLKYFDETERAFYRILVQLQNLVLKND